MKAHKRQQVVTRAELDLSKAVREIREELGLTDIEYLMWLADQQPPCS